MNCQIVLANRNEIICCWHCCFVSDHLTEHSPCKWKRENLQRNGAPLVVQLVKNRPAMWETWVRSLGWGDPLEKGKTTHSSILAWRIPWTVKSMGSQRAGHAWETFTAMKKEEQSMLLAKLKVQFHYSDIHSRQYYVVCQHLPAKKTGNTHISEACTSLSVGWAFSGVATLFGTSAPSVWDQ